MGDGTLERRGSRLSPPDAARWPVRLGGAVTRNMCSTSRRCRGRGQDVCFLNCDGLAKQCELLINYKCVQSSLFDVFLSLSWLLSQPYGLESHFDETWSWPCSQVFPVQKEGWQFAAGKIGTEHPLLCLCLARSFFVAFSARDWNRADSQGPTARHDTSFCVVRRY